MELILITPESDEWNYMWKWLAEHPINEGITEPTIAYNEGESWQYMGSYKQKERVIHTFRHRNFPKGNYVKTLSVSASPNLTPNQISKEFKL